MPGNVELGHVADAAATVQKTAENPTANAPNLLEGVLPHLHACNICLAGLITLVHLHENQVSGN